MNESGYYPDPLAVSHDIITTDARFRMRVVASEESLWDDLAVHLCGWIRHNNEARRKTRVMFLGHWLDYRRAALRLESEGVNCAQLVAFHAGDYCDAAGRGLPMDHPLSLRGRFLRDFCLAIRPEFRPRQENVVYPDPEHPGAFGARVMDEGGVEVCYGSIGLDAHLGFESGQPRAGDSYFELPTRLLTLSPEALLESALEAGSGDIRSVPPMAVSASLTEVMRSAHVRLYLQHGWQSAALRRALYGEVTPRYPASILQRHPELSVTMLPCVARAPGVSPLYS